ncbi:hypothetical protein [Galbibacter sp. PAP.153]|uniref:hypothetical protein n=1 Tax=Galbibacter sp. PAP.153 TaxID=3104623 RepID=UPI00300A969F
MMNLKASYAYRIGAVYIWIGLIIAISFMEAWLKFQAPGITLALGLGIGKLVFHALNYMECVLLLIVLLHIVYTKEGLLYKSNCFIIIIASLLLLQTFWLLPALDSNAQIIIAGKDPPGSLLHYVYVGFEMIKTGCLFLYGRKQLYP